MRSARATFDLAGGDHPPCAAARRLHGPRARGDAPGDAALHVASPAVRRRSARPRAALRARRRAAPRASGRDSRRPRDARRRRAAIPFGWDNEFGAHRVDVAAFEIDVHNVTNARVPRVRRRRRLRDARAVDATPAGSGASTRASTHPAFWVRERRRSGTGAGCSRIPAAAGVAGVREPRGSGGVRALAGRGCRPRPSISARRSARPRQRADVPWGDAAAGRARGNFDFARGIRSGRRHPRGASAWGVHDLVGNGWEWTSTVFAPFPGFAPMASYPSTRPTSSTASTT